MTIVSFIGLPCSGKGAVIMGVQQALLSENINAAPVSTSKLVSQLLTDADKELMKGGGLFPREPELRDAVYGAVEGCFALGATVVLLDGFPRFDGQVRWMRQTFYTYPIQFIEIRARDEFELAKRAAQRNRDEFDIGDRFHARLREQTTKLASATNQILTYALPLTTVINDYVDRAVLDCVGRIKLPKPEKKHK